MSNFRTDLKRKIKKNWNNSFGKDNHDQYRFGPFKSSKSFKSVVKKIMRYLPFMESYSPYHKLATKYLDGLEFLYSRLSNNDRELLTDVIAYRILGPEKIKLPLNTPEYWKWLEQVEVIANKKDIINPGFMHFKLHRTNISILGYPVDLYYTISGIVTTFIVEQYAYKKNGCDIVVAEPEDVVLDLGGCWGDTALYFASKVGVGGQVFSFEFIPNNIRIYDININLNPELRRGIALIENPVASISESLVYYEDKGPASKVAIHPFSEQTGHAKTISIDDFVEKHSLEKIDFIKMDIEGAEPEALKGALKTIRKFKPKLAIAIYHSMDDFVNIPKWICDLNLGYELYLGHYKIHKEETVLFAKTTQE